MLFTVILLQGTFTLLVYAHAGRTKALHLTNFSLRTKTASELGRQSKLKLIVMSTNSKDINAVFIVLINNTVFLAYAARPQAREVML